MKKRRGKRAMSMKKRGGKRAISMRKRGGNYATTWMGTPKTTGFGVPIHVLNDSGDHLVSIRNGTAFDPTTTVRTD